MQVPSNEKQDDHRPACPDAPRWVLATLIVLAGAALMIASVRFTSPARATAMQGKAASQDSTMARIISAACNGDCAAARSAYAELRDDVPAHRTAASEMLHIGATLGHANIVRLALEQRADADDPSLSGCTALMMTAGTAESLEVARALLNAGADVNASDSLGFTPLRCAELAGDTALARLLIERGAVDADPATLAKRR